MPDPGLLSQEAQERGGLERKAAEYFVAHFPSLSEDEWALKNKGKK